MEKYNDSFCFTMWKLEENREISVPRFPWRSFPMFFLLNLDSSEVSTIFLTGNAKSKVLHYLKMHHLTTFATVSDVCLSKFSYNNRYLESESSKRNLSTVNQCTSGQYLISSEWIHEIQTHMPTQRWCALKISKMSMCVGNISQRETLEPSTLLITELWFSISLATSFWVVSGLWQKISTICASIILIWGAMA